MFVAENGTFSASRVRLPEVGTRDRPKGEVHREEGREEHQLGTQPDDGSDAGEVRPVDRRVRVPGFYCCCCRHVRHYVGRLSGAHSGGPLRCVKAPGYRHGPAPRSPERGMTVRPADLRRRRTLLGRGAGGSSIRRHLRTPSRGGTTMQATATVLVYSDDANTREQVRLAVGRRPAADLPPVEYVECATLPAVLERAGEAAASTLCVLDGEAAPAGGMGVCRQVEGRDLPLPAGAGADRPPAGRLAGHLEPGGRGGHPSGGPGGAQRRPWSTLLRRRDRADRHVRSRLADPASRPQSRGRSARRVGQGVCGTQSVVA